MPQNEQAASTPYSADNLAPHDKDLRYILEFGTEVTEEVGESFTTNQVLTPDIPASIDARRGVLQLESFSEEVEGDLLAPRGNTFLMPDWDTFPASPAAGGVIFSVMYAKICLKQTPLDFSAGYGGVPSFGLVLAPENYVGQVAVDAEAQFFGQFPAGSVTDILQTGLIVGDTVSPISSNILASSASIYFCILHSTDGVAKSDVVPMWSHDGACWYSMLDFVSGLGVDYVTRRVGLYVQGALCASLDWFRSYQYVIEEITTNGANPFQPPFPDTGGRLYIP